MKKRTHWAMQNAYAWARFGSINSKLDVAGDRWWAEQQICITMPGIHERAWHTRYDLCVLADAKARSRIKLVSEICVWCFCHTIRITSAFTSDWSGEKIAFWLWLKFHTINLLFRPHVHRKIHDGIDGPLGRRSIEHFSHCERVRLAR